MSKLIIVPTPIGNLGDISERAQNALYQCDVVLCEDTRVCGKLLARLKVKKKMLNYRDDNEEQQVAKIIELIKCGKIVCLTSDAGTPGISDPGFRIVRMCRKLGLPVEPLPGPCASITALSASGLPSDGFLFLGFLPNKTSARVKIFQNFVSFDYSIIFYESCHRIVKFLSDLNIVMGPDRIVCVAKELTKMHEKFYVGVLGQVLCDIKSANQKGEYTIIVAPQRFDLFKDTKTKIL